MSGFRPVHSGSDYACLTIMPVLLPHTKGLNWSWHYLSDHWSQERLPLRRICLVMEVLHSEQYKKLFTFFDIIINFRHWNGTTADKELYWTMSESKIISLIVQTGSNGWLVFFKSDHISGLANAITMYFSSFVWWSFIIWRVETNLCAVWMWWYSTYSMYFQIKHHRIFLWLYVYTESRVYDTASGVSSSASAAMDRNLVKCLV